MRSGTVGWPGLSVELPTDWPPEYHNADRLRFTRSAVEDRRGAGWWLHYIVVTHVPRPPPAGVAGYKGPPVDGSVEIGYSIVPSWQRRGLAPEAVRMLVTMGLGRGVEVVHARTPAPSRPLHGVLRKARIRVSRGARAGMLRFELRRSSRSRG